jgi:class 3 adenylate cyclase/tetratricopeptide (TPR) repeat protein
VKLCPGCGTENAERARFCGECGEPLATAAAIREERKVVTVMFADVVGFTSRSESLDVEDVGAFLEPYHRLIAAEVERYGGTIAKLIGDGVMALFGAPVAHEDDAERAVRAALAIQHELACRREQQASTVHTRIGVTTGQVLLRLADTGQVDAIGDTVNTAARLESAAPVDGVLVGERTQRATRHAIEYRDVEPVHAKGKTDALRAFTAQGLRRATDDARPPAAPFVGREQELDRLWSCLEQVRDTATAQLITILGIPGAGKTRVVEELRRRGQDSARPTLWRQGRCLPYGEGAPFWAFAEIVKTEAGVADADGAEVAGSKLHERVAEAFADSDEAVWVESQLRPLLGLDELGGSIGDHNEAFAAWRLFIEAVAEGEPAVLVFEDLHWADESTFDLVAALATAGAAPLLILCTARPELRERWSDGLASEPAAVIELDALSAGDTEELITRLLGDAQLPEPLREAVISRAAGNPLYAQEYVRMLMDADPKGDVPLPDSIRGIIAARIDGLRPEERVVLLDAAVIGADFSEAAVTYVSGRPLDQVRECLAGLARKRLTERRGTSDAIGEYAFAHALIRDGAYEVMVRTERAAKHELAATWIERHDGRRDDRVDAVARHLQLALEYRRAAGEDPAELQDRTRRALSDAGRRAEALGAFTSALRMLGDAVALCPADDPDRGKLLLNQGRTMLAAGLDGEEVLRESCALLERAGAAESLASARLELSVLLYHHGDPEGADAELTAAYESLRDAPPSRIKATATGLMARTELEAGNGSVALRLAHEAVAAADGSAGAEVAGYVIRQLGMVEIATGDADGIDRISAPIAELEQQGLLTAAAAHRSDLASVQIDLGRLSDAALMLAEMDAGSGRSWARITEGDVAGMRASLAYWAGDWDAAAAIVEPLRGSRESAQAVVPENALLTQIALGRGDAMLADRLSGEALAAARADRDMPSLMIALALRARVLAGRDADEAAALVHEAASCWRNQTPLFGAILPTAAAVYERLGRGAEGIAALDAVRMPTAWLHPARLLLGGERLRAAAAYTDIGSVPDAAETYLLAARAFATDGQIAEADRAAQQCADICTRIGADGLLAELVPAES